MSEASDPQAEAESAQSSEAGPADVHDPAVLREAKRAAVWVGVVGLAALAILLAYPLLVVFGGVVFAALIDGGARLLGRVLNIGRTWRVTIVLLATAVFFAWLVLFAGNQLATEAAALPATLQTQWTGLLDWLANRGLAIEVKDLQGMAKDAMGGIGQLTRAVGGLIGAATNAVLILVLGIYFAYEPRLYRRGLSWMVPVEQREHFSETTRQMGHNLRRLLAGRLLGMFVEGIATWALLALWGVPMAALLGLLTGLLAFLPNIGAIVSGVLMVLVGFSDGTETGLYTVFVYVFVQTVDGYIIVPLIAKKTVDLAPALVLGAQFVMGVLFGVLGILLADPLVAMLKVWLERSAEQNGSARPD